MNRSPSLPPPATRQRPPRRAALAAALLACFTATAVAPGDAAAVSFTGSSPVYLASWFNGSFTETPEFQFALDLQGYCNSHPGAVCSTLNFWGSAGTWGGTLPGEFDDVFTPAGSVVTVQSFGSIYQGAIGGASVLVHSINAEGRIDVGGRLQVGNGTFAELAGAGTLVTQGLSTVSLLATNRFNFAGSGVTQVVAFQTPNVSLGIGSGHDLEYVGTAPLTTALTLAMVPGSTFTNRGDLRFSGGFIGLQGTATYDTVPRFVNAGTVNGNMFLAFVGYDNRGLHVLASGEELGLGVRGTHTGTFSGAAGSTYSFSGSISGAVGDGQQFLPGSRVISDGLVQFTGGRHDVQGEWRTQTTKLLRDSWVDFQSVAVMPRLQVGDGTPGTFSVAQFSVAGDLVLGDVSVDGGRLEFNNTGGVRVANLTLQSGVLKTQRPFSVEQTFTWNDGVLTPDVVLPGQALRVVELQGDSVWGAGSRSLVALELQNSGTIHWNAGSFGFMAGQITNLPLARFEINGDFGSAPGGVLGNAGLLVKTAGAGRAELGMAIFNQGVIRAESGTLALPGGGEYGSTSSLVAAPGAIIELGGSIAYGSAVPGIGRVDVTGGSFVMRGQSLFVGMAGAVFTVQDFGMPGASTFRSGGDFSTGTFTSSPAASFTATGAFRATGAVNNDGQFVAASGVAIDGAIHNAGSLLGGDNFLARAGIVNAATGSIGFAPAATVFMEGGLDNAGRFAVGAGAHAESLGLVSNRGALVNDGTWTQRGGFDQHAGGAGFDNNGSFRNLGPLQVLAGGVVRNAGSFVNGDAAAPGAVVFVAAGGSFSGGSYTQDGGTTNVKGTLDVRELVFNAGVMTGNGHYHASDLFSVGPGVIVQPGNSPGRLTVDGDVSFDQSRFEIEIAGTGLYDQLYATGNLGINGGTVQLLFAPGYVPRDGDEFTWLLADGGLSGVAPTVAAVQGLGADWAVEPGGLGASSARFIVGAAAAAQVPLSGDFSIAAGATGKNSLTLDDAGGVPALGRLDNAGTFSNRSGATASVGTLANAAGASVLNRGQLVVQTLTNAGEVANLAGAQLSGGNLVNSGRIANDGSLALTGLDNQAGGRIDNRGTLQAYSLVNAGELVVSGSVRTANLRNSASLTVSPGGLLRSLSEDPAFTTSYLHSGSQASTRVDGRIDATTLDFVGGQLSGRGTLAGQVSLDGLVTLDMLDKQGGLRIDGGLSARQSQFKFYLGGTTAGDVSVLPVGGAASFNGFDNFTFYLVDGWRPGLGEQLTWLAAGGGVSFAATDAWQIYTLDADGHASFWGDAGGIVDPTAPAGMQVGFADGHLVFALAAVPEPAPLALMLAGVLGLALVRARRKDRPMR